MTLQQKKNAVPRLKAGEMYWCESSTSSTPTGSSLSSLDSINAFIMNDET